MNPPLSQGPVHAVPRGWQTGLRLASKIRNPEAGTMPILEPARKCGKFPEGAPQCWGLACMARPGSQGLLATDQQLLPALTAVLWPALCRKARSISSAEAVWMRRGGKKGRTMGGGAHRATEAKNRGDIQRGKERREIFTGRDKERERASEHKETERKAVERRRAWTQVMRDIERLGDNGRERRKGRGTETKRERDRKRQG